MDTIVPENDIPRKKCANPNCENPWLPATPEFFHRSNGTKDGFNAYCKPCRTTKQKNYLSRPDVQANGSFLAICACCNKEFLATRNQRTGKPVYCSKGCVNTQYKALKLPDSIVEEYNQGSTLLDLAQKYHTNETTMWTHLKKLGVTMRTGNESWKNGHPLKFHTDEAKQKIREAAIKQFSDPKAREEDSQRTIQRMIDGKVKRVSSLEDRVAIELSRRGFVFGRQQGIPCKGHRGYIGCVDFLLVDGRVIEVNGTFWHADPRKYPDGPVYPSQKYAAERYNKKVAILAELGTPLIELWEIDLMADFTGTIDKALSSQ